MTNMHNILNIHSTVPMVPMSTILKYNALE